MERSRIEQAGSPARRFPHRGMERVPKIEIRFQERVDKRQSVAYVENDSRKRFHWFRSIPIHDHAG
jgi:hypothetical protein